MKLRTELMPPVLDKALVKRLTYLVSTIDGGDQHAVAPLLQELNQLASAQFDFYELQGIEGGQDHITWARTVLATSSVRLLADVTREELVELVRRVMAAEGPEHSLNFWLEMLEANLPNCAISDLIFWPSVYFEGTAAPRDLSAERVVEIALADSGRKTADDRVV
ncbi:hypothetical protein [Pseudomonas sp. UBA6562]|uniref:hypothetical protein n=1 Tax=Pseudomonas sp. UBA6562 TaxID=1947332 RepID=UPI0025D21693|nr:hypothetical protein [Pseudomonas sp. UBA6562]